MSISALPTPPGPGDSRDVFNTRAFALLGALPTFVNEANALATGANTAATNAGNSATAASGYANSSSTNAAAAQQAATTAINAPATTATSTSDVAVGTGSKSWTLAQTGKAFTVGQWVYLADAASPSTRWCHGTITAFNPATGAITVNVVRTAGANNCANWLVMPASPDYSVLTFDGSGNLSVQGNLVLTGSLRPTGGDTQRLIQSTNTSPSTPQTQFYVDHSFGTTIIGNGRGILNLASPNTVQANGNDIWHTGNFNPAAKQDALGYTPYNASNPSGFISGINSGMVTGALGFTPYNATNPSGFITSAGTSAKALTLAQAGTGSAMTFNWSGQGGQPSWVWGGSDGVNHYVYNPSNFSVNYANSAGSAGTATNLSGGSVSATTVTATGLIKGNNGGVGLGRILTTTTTGSPSGMSVGDLVLVY